MGDSHLLAAAVRKLFWPHPIRTRQRELGRMWYFRQRARHVFAGGQYVLRDHVDGLIPYFCARLAQTVLLSGARR